MKTNTGFGLLLLIFLFLFPLVKAENQDTTKRSQVTTIPFEKAYLFLDRSYYGSGEDIWFKAYLVDALSNKLSDNSKCLYVELISPESQVLQRITIRLEKGTGSGDFHLRDSVPSGKYMVRAYTNWMRNFGEIFFFKKEIEVVGFIDKPMEKTKPQLKEEHGTDIQFFPEGGSLVQNVYSTVGFKAIDTEGMGISVTGKVVSSKGDTVTNLGSTHLGMGSFNLIPKQGLTYFVTGTTKDGVTFRKELPVALPQGYVLKVTDADNTNLRVTVKTNQETLNPGTKKKIIIAGSSHGSLCITAQLEIKSLVVNAIIPKQNFSEGIARITLFDSTFKPYCERLMFIHYPKKTFLNIKAEHKLYAPRQKVTLQISVTDTANQPVSANLSLSATDGNLVKTQGKHLSDIYSYLLLESEIRGHIEEPSSYFDTTETDRFKNMDLLLLTQGWRDFIWKYLSDTTIKLTYPVEKGITLSGSLRRLLVNKPIANANISIGIFGDNGPYLNITQTDSTGKYYFGGLNFTGSRSVIVSAANKNHRNEGIISLDTTWGDLPKGTFHWMYKPEKIRESVSEFKEEADRRYEILKQYRLSDTIALGDVIVKGRKIQKEENDDHSRLYSTADFSLKVTDEYAGYSDVFQLLQGRVAGLMISGAYPNISFSMRGSKGQPLFLLDDMPVDIDFISSLPVSQIDKVEVLKSGGNLAIFGMQGGNGVISIYTKKGYVSQAKPVFHSINTKVNGYYQARTFYSPNYEVKNPEYEKPDLRNTIFWAPTITTDENGKATLSFFNSDSANTVKVEVQGITDSGIPLTGKTSYQVK